MKLASVLALSIVLVLLVWLLWSRPGSAPSPVSVLPQASAPTTVAATPDASASEALLAAAETPPRSTREAAPVAPHAVPEGAARPACRIFGRLVDETGAPLPGIRVIADSVGGPWANGVELPKTSIEGDEIEALAGESDPAGHFSLEAPVPTSDWVSLFILPDEFHGLLDRNFGPAGGRNQPRLVSGDNDLGDLVLSTTGAIEGRVRGRDGSPIEKAEVSLDGEFPGGLVVSTRSEAGGHFLLGHMPQGTWHVGAKVDGWLSAQSDPVQVRIREVTRGIEMTLDMAPSISGLVVDESGKPVPGVRLWAWPRSSGQGAGARSAADGSFTMHLPQNDSYRLDFDPKGFEHYGGHGSDPVPPGTSDLRVVLRRGSSMTFAVVDAETSQPIERYGITLQVFEGDGWSRSESADPPRLEDHPGGESRLVLPKGKAVAHLEAPGHAPAGAEIAEDPRGSGRQTIRLSRGSSLSGRALKGGAPVANTRAVLERCSTKIDASIPDEPPEERFFSDNYRFDLSPFVGRRREVATDAGGRFQFVDLAAGTYVLTLRDNSSAPLVREGLKVGAGQATDLGDFTLESGAGIRGRLVLPPGRSAQGWEVVLDDTWPNDRRELAADGRFLFEGLTPGRHVIRVRSPASHEHEPVREVDLPPGRTVEVDVDVSALLPGELTVGVTREGRPLPGLKVRCRCEPPNGGGSVFELPTGADGRTSGTIPACDAIELEAVSAAGLRIGRAREPVVIVAGGTSEAEIDIVAGELTLAFPEGFRVPEKGIAYVILRPPAEEAQDFQMTTLATSDNPFFGSNLEWKGTTVDLGLVAAGEYEVTVQVSRLVPRDQGGTVQNVFEPVSNLRDRVTLARGVKTTCALAPAKDR